MRMWNPRGRVGVRLWGTLGVWGGSRDIEGTGGHIGVWTWEDGGWGHQDGGHGDGMMGDSGRGTLV